MTTRKATAAAMLPRLLWSLGCGCGQFLELFGVEPEGAVGWALAAEDAGDGFEPATTEGVFGWKECKSLGVEVTKRGSSVEGEGFESPGFGFQEWGEDGLAALEACGWGVVVEVDEGCSEGVKAVGYVGDVAGRGKEVGKELGGEASFFYLGKGLDGFDVESDGEG